MSAAIRVARERGLLGASVLGSGRAFDMEVRVGAGAYVCGEETCLLNSLEGKRGVVRAKPPLPAIEGLFGLPTVVNNVISLATVPGILAKGAAFYQDFGLGRSRGTIPIQIAGNVRLRRAVRDRLRHDAWARSSRRSAAARPSGRPVKAVQVGGPLGAYFPRVEVRHALRLRGVRRPGRADRPRRHRRLRRQRRHAEDGALRHGVLRRRELRQVHPLPHRRGAGRRDHRPDRPGRRRRDPAPDRPLRHHAGRIALRAGRLHALPGDVGADALPATTSPPAAKEAAE